MSEAPSPYLHILKKEATLLVSLLFIGLIVLPIVIWFVGKAVFGAYGGAGYVEFFGSLSGKIRAGNLAAWFLVLSPWLAVQVIRLAAVGWRMAGKV